MEYKGIKLFEDDIHNGDKFRQEYLSDVNAFIEKQFEKAYKTREEHMTPDALKKDQEKFRNEYLDMIGFPKEFLSDKIPDVKKEYAGCDELSEVYRLSIEVMDGYHFYGILFIPKKPYAKKSPLVIAQHGGGGTPESCSDMNGQNNYNNFTKRALEKGFAVFAPSLMLWRFNLKTGETFPQINIEYDRGAFDCKLKQLGYSMTGMEVFSIMRSIDYLVSLDYIDGEKIGMMGLSYGGYFSLYTAAADTRIKSIYACGFFNDRSRICFMDWGYKKSALIMNDAEVAGLCAPRKLRFDVGKTDAVFNYEYSIPEAERVRKYYDVYGASDKFCYDLWEGGHRFDENLEGFEYFFDGILN